MTAFTGIAPALPQACATLLEEAPSLLGAEGFAAAVAVAQRQAAMAAASPAGLPVDGAAVPEHAGSRVSAGRRQPMPEEPARELEMPAALLAAASPWLPVTEPATASAGLTAHDVAECVRQLWALASERDPVWQLELQDAGAPALQLTAVPGAQGWAITLSNVPVLASLNAERLRERLLLRGQRIEALHIEPDAQAEVERP